MTQYLQSFTLAEVLVSPARNQLSAGGQTVRLQPKAMAVLCYLARHYERVIDNDELIEQVWQGRVVTYGSVQKSINLLRKALAELLGEREVVAHYSKRGYQLRIEPVYQALSIPRSSATDRKKMWLLAGLALGGAAALLLAWLLLPLPPSLPPKSHQQVFEQVQGYTNEVGHEREAVPHPQLAVMAYVRHQAAEGSQLVVRDERGRDWVVAESPGAWQHLEWSPSGRQLAVIEDMDGREHFGPWMPSSRLPQQYNVHVFALDVAAARVVEKHRLSHWQGHINSLAWWDEQTLELVGRQGIAAINQRYRYELESQRLFILPSLERVPNPLASRISQQFSAIASYQQSGVRLDFYAPSGRHLAARQLAARQVQFSWIPDGSGVLAYLPDTRQWLLIYRDGTAQTLTLPGRDSHPVVLPRFGPQGQRIYFTEQRPSGNIWRQDSAGQQRVTDNAHLNYGARWSPEAERLAYISVRNHRPQVWLVDSERERQVSRQLLAEPVRLLWEASGEALIYTAGEALYVYDLAAEKEQLLWRGSGDFTPLALDREQQQLLALRSTGEVSNLWRINYGTGEKKQLTFGAVTTALAQGEAVYFQYAGQPGLWRWQGANGELELLNKTLEGDSRLLAVTDRDVYYRVGGDCQEGDIVYRQIRGGEPAKVINGAQTETMTTDFHPQRGALYSHCRVPEADILYWQ